MSALKTIHISTYRYSLQLSISCTSDRKFRITDTIRSMLIHGSRLAVSPEATRIPRSTFIYPAFALEKVSEQLFLGLVFRCVPQDPRPLAAHLAVYLLGIGSKHITAAYMSSGSLTFGLSFSIV
jgi:hypothetical protein